MQHFFKITIVFLLVFSFQKTEAQNKVKPVLARYATTTSNKRSDTVSKKQDKLAKSAVDANKKHRKLHTTKPRLARYGTEKDRKMPKTNNQSKAQPVIKKEQQSTSSSSNNQ